MHTFILCIFIFLIPCMFACSLTNDPVIELSTHIMVSSCKQLHKEYNLTLYGSGYCGSLEGKLSGLNLTLTSDKQVDIQEARKLLILSCEQLLTDINKNTKIRPWLSQHPYTANNLDLMIGFKTSQNKLIEPPFIALVAVMDGKIRYSIHENEKFNAIHRETYEEALLIYQNQLK